MTEPVGAGGGGANRSGDRTAAGLTIGHSGACLSSRDSGNLRRLTKGNR
jgi:hypothetical protein